MPLTAPDATLIAATAAGVLSLLNLFVTARRERSGEARAQYRGLLAPHAVAFGEKLHEALASADIAANKSKSEESRQKYVERCKSACGELKVLRQQLRYPLWRVEEPMRTITRLGDWLGVKLANPDEAKALVLAADKLRLHLDLAVKEALIAGVPPGRWRQFRCSRSAKMLRQTWRTRRPDQPEVGDDEP